MNHRLLKGAIIFAAGILAVAVYLGIDQKTSAKSQLSSARQDWTLLKTHSSVTTSGDQDRREKEMLMLALEKSPGHAPVLLKLAEIESKAGDLQKAVVHLRKILNSEPGNPDANLELGRVLFELGDVRGSIEHTQAILKMNPMHEDALYNMGAIYANIGNKKNAVEYWKRLSSLHSNSENAQKAQLMINRLETSNP